jgi:hypothetical protein
LSSVIFALFPPHCFCLRRGRDQARGAIIAHEGTLVGEQADARIEFDRSIVRESIDDASAAHALVV